MRASTACEDDLVAARPLAWIPAGRRHFVLPLGVHGQVHVVAFGDRWIVSHVGPDAAPPPLSTARLDAALAQGEARAQRLGVAHLSEPRAAWRGAPATAAQHKALAAWRVSNAPDRTRGEALAHIASAIARARRARRALARG